MQQQGFGIKSKIVIVVCSVLTIVGTFLPWIVGREITHEVLLNGHMIEEGLFGSFDSELLIGLAVLAIISLFIPASPRLAVVHRCIATMILLIALHNAIFFNTLADLFEIRGLHWGLLIILFSSIVQFSTVVITTKWVKNMNVKQRIASAFGVTLLLVGSVFYSVSPEKTCFISDTLCPFEAYVDTIANKRPLRLYELSWPPQTIGFVGELRIDEEDLLLECYAQIWHFGDGTETIRKGECPEAFGDYVSSPFITEVTHTYENPGTYEVFIEVVKHASFIDDEEKVVTRSQSMLVVIPEVNNQSQ